MAVLTTPAFWYALLQFGVLGAFVLTAYRAWQHSRARFVELISAFLFGLVLEQGDIFLFGTYRYNENWVLVGDVPIAIALTWALIIAGAMNITDALGIRTIIPPDLSTKNNRLGSIVRGLPAPFADAVWAILLDLALDAVAIRLGLWTWTIRADEGWFGVPWGNFFAWLFVAFWFSLFTRIVRARAEAKPNQTFRTAQWLVPVLAFIALIATLVPFVAIENTAALPLIPDENQSYQNGVWVIFALTLALFIAVTLRVLVQPRTPREPADHWLLFVRLSIHGLFFLALLATGIYLDAPLLLIVALLFLLVELAFLWHWRSDLFALLRAWGILRRKNAPI